MNRSDDKNRLSKNKIYLISQNNKITFKNIVSKSYGYNNLEVIIEENNYVFKICITSNCLNL